MAPNHAAPSLLFLPDGRLIVFYSKHNGPDMFYRISEAPEEITRWRETKSINVNPEGKKGYTYPNPVLLSEENNAIFLFWRGGNWNPAFSVTTDQTRWSSAQTFLDNPGERPYVKVASDGKNTIHFAYTDGHPDVVPGNNIYYASYRRNAFYRADQTWLADRNHLPFPASLGDKVYDSARQNARAWIWDIALDKKDRPILVFAVFPSETDHYYQYARWDGTAWQVREITPAGRLTPQQVPWIDIPDKLQAQPYYSGGIALDHENPSIVYLSRLINGIFEIERWTTPDGGTTWSVQAVTQNSAKHNLRPLVPRNHPPGSPLGLLWMHGDYPSYKTYQTAIACCPAP